MDQISPVPTSGSKRHLGGEALFLAVEAAFQRLDQFVELLGFEVLEAHAAAAFFHDPEALGKSWGVQKFLSLKTASWQGSMWHKGNTESARGISK